jgi:hypothetical protein
VLGRPSSAVEAAAAFRRQQWWERGANLPVEGSRMGFINRRLTDMRIGTVCGGIALALLASACGTNQEQRSATGALTGAGIGALAGGPFGLVIGGLAGGAAGAATPVGADQVAFWGMDQTREAVAGTPVLRDMAREEVGRGGSGRAASGSSTPQRTASAPAAAGGSEPNAVTLRVTPDTVKQIQSSLRGQGLYGGPIDGIMGRETEQAIAAYQQKQGLPRTAVLDARTVQALTADTGGR